MQEITKGNYMNKADTIINYVVMIEDLSDLRARATTPTEWSDYHDKIIETYDELKSYLYEVLRLVN